MSFIILFISHDDLLASKRYAMHRSRSQGVAVYFWPRTSTEVPSAVSRGYGLIQPDYTWGVPQAYFPFTSSCDYGTHFDAHKMVFDLTFCVRGFLFSSHDDCAKR